MTSSLHSLGDILTCLTPWGPSADFPIASHGLQLREKAGFITHDLALSTSVWKL